jgi:hypothetical protein
MIYDYILYKMITLTAGNYLPEMQQMEGLGHMLPLTHEDDHDLDGGSLMSSDLSFLMHDFHSPPHPSNQ